MPRQPRSAGCACASAKVTAAKRDDFFVPRVALPPNRNKEKIDTWLEQDTEPSA